MHNTKFMKKVKRLLSGFVAAAMATTMLPTIPAFAATGTTTYTYDGYTVDYTVANEWDNGQSVEVKITNTGDESILNWAFKYDAEGEIDDLWNATIVENNNTDYVVKNNGWNYEIAPNQSINFGYTLTDDNFEAPSDFELCSERVNLSEGYDVNVNITNSWDSGVQGELVISNTSDSPIEAWTLTFDTNFVIDNLWNGRIIEKTDTHYTIASEMWTNPIPVGGSTTIGFVGINSVDNEAIINNFSLESVIVNYFFSPVISEKTTEAFYAFAEYDPEANAIGLAWSSSDGTGVYRIYEKSQEKQLIAEVTDNVVYFYTLDSAIKKDEYIFVIEKTLSENEFAISNDVVMHLGDNEIYEFVYIDSDDDELPDIYEFELGTDITVADSDDDGLTDGYEFFILGTNPTVIDTDDNGINDGDEDFDNDGLDNCDEHKLNTNPFNFDTDNDGYSDSYEVDCAMNPLLYDEIIIDNSVINNIQDNTINDLENLNINEYYPLEIELNDTETQITSISGVFSNQIVDSPVTAIYSLYSIKTLLGLSNPQELKYTKSFHSKSGTTYTFSQCYKGFEIYGRTLTVSVDNEGKVTSLNSSVLSEDVLGDISLSPIITEAELTKIITNEYGETEINSVNLVIYVGNNSLYPSLAYIAETSTYNTIIISAINGEVISTYAEVDYGMTTGSGTDELGNAVTFPVNETGFWFFKKYKLEDTDRKIHIYNAADSDNLYTSENNIWTDSVAISAYTNTITTYDWWKDEFAYDGIDGKGGAVKIYVHDSGSSDNASYIRSDPAIKFGDVTLHPNTFAAYLDIVGHEYTHAVFRHLTSINNAVTARTINEAYADIFGSFVNNNTWMTYPRDLTSPNNTNNPDFMGGTYYSSTTTDPHLNSTVISHAAYKMQNTYHISFDKLSVLWYDSMGEGFDDSSDFNTVRTNVIKSARKNNFTYDEIRNIRKAFDDVGIYGDTGDADITIYDSGTPVIDAKVTLIHYGDYNTQKTDSTGTASLIDLNVGLNTIKIEIAGQEPIFTHIMIKKGQTVSKTINILTSMSNFAWDEYDHYNYSQPYVSAIPKHIEFSGNDIKMIGYTVQPFKDFLLTNGNDDPTSFVQADQKILSFSIKRDSNNWHTMEGGGFLFNVKIADNLLYCHCILVTSQGLKLYEINGVDIDKFREGQLGNISTIGKLLGTYDIGNVLDNHEITIRITDSIIGKQLWVWDGDDMIVDSKILFHDFGEDFGPITSHISHYCSQISYFTFSDIQMSSIS